MSDPKARFQTAALRITQRDSEVLTSCRLAAAVAAMVQDQCQSPSKLRDQSVCHLAVAVAAMVQDQCQSPSQRGDQSACCLAAVAAVVAREQDPCQWPSEPGFRWPSLRFQRPRVEVTNRSAQPAMQEET